MKKRILTAILASIVAISMLPMMIFAVEPGESDYTVTTKQSIAEAKNGKLELTNTTTGTIVSVPVTSLPAGIESVSFQAKPIEVTDALTDLAVKSAKAKNGMIFDFNLLDQNNNKVAKLNGKISITMPCPAGINAIFYYDESTDKAVELPSTISNGFITFETDHFSFYMLAEVAAKKSPGATVGGTNNGFTGDTFPMTTVIVVAVIAVAGLSTILITKKIKSSKNI